MSRPVSLIHGLGCGPRAGGRIVEFSGTDGVVLAAPADDQDSAIRQQGCGVPAADIGQLAGGDPRAGGRVVQLGRVGPPAATSTVPFGSSVAV